MKKTKLITSLSTLGVLATSTPFIATSCSTTLNTQRDNKLLSQPTIEGFELPSKMYVNNIYTTVVRFRSESGVIVPADWKIEEGTSWCLNATVNSSLVTINPSRSAINKTNLLVIGAYINGIKKAEETYKIDSVIDDFDIVCSRWNLLDIQVGTPAHCDLHLFYNEYEISTGVEWNITYGTDKSLNAKIVDNKFLYVQPSLLSAERVNKIMVEAYWNGKYTTTKEIIIDNVVVSSNYMRYDGKDYELDARINPRVFETQDYYSWGPYFGARDIPLRGGEKLHIDANQTAWNKLTHLAIVKCSHKQMEFIVGFLAYCDNLEWVNLSGLKKIEYTGVLFLAYCDKIKTVDLSAWDKLRLTWDEFLSWSPSIETIILPNHEPIFVTNQCRGIMIGLPKTAKIHCGDYLEAYKVAPTWCEFADQMVK